MVRLLPLVILLACSSSGAVRDDDPPAAEAPPAQPAAEGDWAHMTEAQWRARLTPEEFDVLREEGTERAFTGEFHDHHAEGVYVCGGCGQPLYRSSTKFDSGTGWPSYYEAIEGAVETEVDHGLGMTRTEVHCSRCGGHLGHIFPDGPEPTGMRHCINSVSLDFVPASEAAALEANAAD